MEICKFNNVRNFLFLIFIFFHTSSSATSFDDIEKLKISNIDIIVLKFENYLLDKKSRLFVNDPFMMVYAKINFNAKYTSNEKIQISIIGTLNKARYKKIKYSPNKKDCNMIRNKIFYNKYGYNILTRKKNNYPDENSMKEILIGNIYDISTLNEKEKNFLIDNSYIKILIVHPNESKNVSCIGKIADFELM